VLDEILKVKFIASLAMVVLLASCSGKNDRYFDVPVEKVDAFFFGYTNLKILEFKNIRIRSNRSKEQYSQVFIGVPSAPYEKSQNIFLTTPDGSVMNLSSPNAVTIIRSFLLDPLHKDPVTLPLKIFNLVKNEDEYWPKDTERYRISENLTFYTNDENVIGVFINSAIAPSVGELPKIGIDPDNLFLMPLNEYEVKALFGVPDNIYVTLQNYS
jgi:hypothetical protein